MWNCEQFFTTKIFFFRFPRITKIRDDKDWESATSLKQLVELTKLSEQTKKLLFKPEEADGKTNKAQQKAKNPKKFENENETDDEKKRI